MQAGAGEEVPDLIGLHHVRLPVSDVLVSRDWYVDLLGLQPVLVVEDEDGVTGVVLGHPGGLTIGLHKDPRRARALKGFAAFAIAVPDLAEWVRYLDRRGVRHSEVQDRHLGRSLQVVDPDGLLVDISTPDQPSADEA